MPSPRTGILGRLLGRKKRSRHPAPVAAATDLLEEYGLDVSPGCRAPVVGADGVARSPRVGVAHGDDALSVFLEPGDVLDVPAVRGHAELTVALRCTLASGSGDAELALVALDEAGNERASIATLTVSGGSAASGKTSLAVPSAEPLRLSVRAAADNGATIGLQQLLVAPSHRLGRANALAGYRHRLHNELQHFDASSYQHAMYGDDAKPDGDGAAAARVLDPQAGAAAPASRERQRERVREVLQTVEPEAGEVAFNYSMRALQRLLPIEPPNFLDRADHLPGDGPLRMLSICAGAARIEEMIVTRARRPIELTLLDASEDLANRAAARLSSIRDGSTATCLIGDVNAGLPGDQPYDVIMCVSALHHVADLETVFAHIGERLSEHGEFWSVGEQVGRNGNRLWPDDLAAANEAFAQLPPRFRHNRHTAEVDARISDRDYSTGCFEGIRSQELETMLEAHLVPIQVYKRNVFLWRIVDATYGDNFDLGDEEGLACLRDVIAAEALRWAAGGVSTELHGIYGKKALTL